MQLFVAEAVFGERADLEVLDQDIGLGDQLQRDLLALLLADIQRDRALVAVDADEVGAFLGAGHERGREAARVVAGARPLDLDDIGAKVGQHLRAGRTRQHPGEVEYAQAFQRAGGVGHSVSPDAGQIGPIGSMTILNQPVKKNQSCGNVEMPHRQTKQEKND